MHDHADGYVLPTRLFVANDSEPQAPIHQDYAPTRDRVRGLIGSDTPLQRRLVIRGDLPLGVGLAGSTLLARLWFDQLSVDATCQALLMIDRQIHGFAPSGVDAEFAFRQRAGFYGPRGWTDADPVHLGTTMLIVPPERARSLPEVRSRVLKYSQELASIAESLRSQVLTGALKYETLIQYSQCLLEAGAYSVLATEITRYLLRQSIVAKCIGGLYDRAILIVWPQSFEPSDRAQFENDIQRLGVSKMYREALAFSGVRNGSKGGCKASLGSGGDRRHLAP